MEENKTEEKRMAKTLAKLKKAGNGFFSEFKTFISKGNILQLAVAFIMGGAFTAIVNSLVGDIFMPFINAIFGKADVADLKWYITDTLVIKYGNFIMAVINFVLVALILFLVIKLAARAAKTMELLKKRHPEELAKAEAEAKAKAAAVPALTKSEELLTEIKDLLKAQNKDEK